MEEILHFCCPWRRPVLPIPRCAAPTIRYYCRRRRCHNLMLLPPDATHVSLPSKPSRSPPPPTSTITTTSPFREKMLFLDTIGVDFFTLATSHPPIVSSPLDELKSTVDLLRSIGLTSFDLHRVCGMCPEILTAKSPDITQVLTFLTREAGVQGLDLRRVISRRPRLLVSDVSCRLRPTLYFLQMLGITDIAKHTSILSCSVEDKLLPRIEFLMGAGLAPMDARAMVRKFPQLFCYSIEENLEPKFDFFTIEMGRDLKELKRFPQYFSFSLPKRIKPRHALCKEKGVFLTLPALLKPYDSEFRARLKDDGTYTIFSYETNSNEENHVLNVGHLQETPICSFHYFELIRIPCSHILAYLNFNRQQILPQCLIKTRWTRRLKDGKKIQIYDEGEGIDSKLGQYMELSRQARED